MPALDAFNVGARARPPCLGHDRWNILVAGDGHGANHRVHHHVEEVPVPDAGDQVIVEVEQMVSFFRSKIRLVAEKVEELIVFILQSFFFEFGVCNRAIWLHLVRLSRSCFIWAFFFFLCVCVCVLVFGS